MPYHRHPMGTLLTFLHLGTLLTFLRLGTVLTFLRLGTVLTFLRLGTVLTFLTTEKIFFVSVQFAVNKSFSESGNSGMIAALTTF
jgi:hypothetical protein